MIGRLLGAVLGFAIKNVIGAIIGYLVGALFDKATRHHTNQGSQQNPSQLSFFKLLFHCLGHIAKADGRVSEAEIEHTERIMRHFDFDATKRQQAIAWFKAGSQQTTLDPLLLRSFLQSTRLRPQLKIMLLETVISLVLVDGVIDLSEERALQTLAQALGIRRNLYDQLMAQVKNQRDFQQQQQQGSSPLSEAYQLLGLNENATDSAIKRAYRKKMSQYHPDKMIAKGLPESMIKMATEKAQAIREAFETIKSKRGFK